MEPTTTTTQDTTTTTTPAAPAAPKTVTMTEAELEEAKRAWRAEGAQQGLDDRFKNWLPPGEVKKLRDEAAAARADRDAKDEKEKTDLQRAQDATSAALNEKERIQRDADARVAQVTAQFDAERKRTAILGAVDSLKKRGVMAESVLAEDVAELTGKHLNVIEGKVVGKDQYERPCTVDDFLTAWVAQPIRANYRPPAPAGTGTAPGRAPGVEPVKPPENADDAWKMVESLHGPKRKSKRPTTGTMNSDAIPSGGAPDQ
jgi:hypothetical protein